MATVPGFRKVRQALDVTEFGVNAIVLPPGYTSRRHYHDRQQELYMVLRGVIEFDFDGAPSRRSGPAASPVSTPPPSARCATRRKSEDAVYLCVGGEGGYVGRDGQVPE